MRTLLAATAFAIAFATPAWALRVTNLDAVTHRITFEAAGTVHARDLAPNATADFNGLPNGRLSLASSPNPRTGTTLNADGVLAGFIGNGRDQQIPADAMDDYTIWPGGKLMLQRRMKQYGSH